LATTFSHPSSFFLQESFNVWALPSGEIRTSPNDFSPAGNEIRASENEILAPAYKILPANNEILPANNEILLANNEILQANNETLQAKNLPTQSQIFYIALNYKLIPVYHIKNHVL
jgi:hypothetical protein